MAVVAADVFERASIFSATGIHPIPSAKVTTFIADAEKRIARELWGDVADLAVIYLTCHLLHLDVLLNSTPITQQSNSVGTAPVGGQISSMSVGSVSVSFSEGGALGSSGSNAFTDDAMGTTPWGKRFIELRDEQMLRGAW